MRLFARLFTDHPASVGESYGGHLVVALGFSLRLFWGGFACLVHAVLPGLCQKSGSRQIMILYDGMVQNRLRTEVCFPPESFLVRGAEEATGHREGGVLNRGS